MNEELIARLAREWLAAFDKQAAAERAAYEAKSDFDRVELQARIVLMKEQLKEGPI